MLLRETRRSADPRAWIMPRASLLASLLTSGLVALALLAFAALCFYHYRLPGLYYDESFDVVPAMQLLKGQDVQLARGVGIHVFGRAFPVMIGDYWGVVSTYAVLPLFAIFGVGVFAIRLWSIGSGLLAVFLTYRLGRRLYGAPVGALAALLLAIFPSYVFWSRTGIYVISHIVAITLGAILSYLRWQASGRRRWLFLSALLAGLGLSTKLLFLWFLIAIPAAYVILLLADWLFLDSASHVFKHAPARAWQRMRRDVPLRSPADAAIAIVAFLLGAFPMLYYNLLSHGSYLVLRANLFQTERGVDNFALWHNVKTELDALRVLLDGGYFWYYGGIYTNPLYPFYTALSVAALLLLVHAVPELRPYRRPTVFLLGFAAVTFLLSCFSVSILGPTHLLILLPIPQLLICASAVFGTRWLAGRSRLRALVPGVLSLLIVAFGLLVARDLWVDRRYHQALNRTGGHSTFSSAIYVLADDLDARGAAHPYALDWGLKYPIMILTEGRVDPQEIFGSTYAPGPDFDTALQTALGDPHAVFISHDEEASVYPRLERFRAAVAASGRTLVLLRTVPQHDGKPVFYVFEVR